MIEINNKAYRNLQEQVKKNMDDIEMLKQRLGYQGPYDSTSEITHPEDKAIYIIGDDAPYHLYQYDGISQTYLDLGPLNIKGDTGETGAQGPQGERGIRGEQGPEGPQGPQGEQGPQGIQGIQGVQGIQGPAGQDGLTTDIYVNGQTYTQVEGTITLPDYPTSLTWDDIEDKPTFATVATTGDYDDLTNKPDLSEFVTTNTDQTLTGDKKYTYTDINNKTYDFSLVQDPTAYGYATHYPSIVGQYTDDNNTYNQMLLNQYGLNYETQYGKITFGNYQIEKHLPYAAGTGVNPPDNWGLAVRTYVYEDEANIDEYDIYFPPKKSGTIALTSDIPDVSNFVTDTELSTELADYELKSEAFSGSYNDLSNKPDLSVYELKTDAFTGNYNDLTNKPDLSVYELKTDAFSGNYNDLTNKPTIPTDTSDLTNGAGFITSSALSGYATETWVGQQGYLTSVSWDDVSSKPTFATVATSGDYDDLLNKPTIPDTTYMVTTNTAQTITGNKTLSGITTFSGSTNSVVFTGRNPIKLKAPSNNTTGFTLFNNSDQEKGYVQYNTSNDGLYLGRWGQYRANELGFMTTNQSSGVHKFLVPNVTLTNNATITDYIPISVNNTKADSSGNISISIPTVPTNVSAFTNDAGYITGITDTMINTALGYTAADAADIPTTATSTSTVTPSTSAFMTSTTKTTETLTFTYTDNTTANITIVTSVTDNTSNAMTGATVSTTTTLS